MTLTTRPVTLPPPDNTPTVTHEPEKRNAEGQKAERSTVRLTAPNAGGYDADRNADRNDRPRKAERSSLENVTEQEQGTYNKGKQNEGTYCPDRVPAALADLPLYAVDAKLCKAWHELLPELQRINPGVDVVAEVGRAHAWEVANPKRRKRNRPRFLHSWCARQQDKPRNGGGGQMSWDAQREQEQDKWIEAAFKKRRKDHDGSTT